MQNTGWLKAFILAILSIITALALIHLASAFVFRNLVIEDREKVKNLELPDREEFEVHEVKFNKSLFGVKNMEQNIHLWFFPIERDDDIPPTIVFCSPSQATLPRLQKIRYLANALSSNLVMFDYRPNGSSSGIISPSLATLTEDVSFVIDWLESEKSIHKEDIILMGYSLGGLPAISAALKYPEIKRLVLVNSFCSFNCLTAERFTPLLNTFMFFRDFFPDLTSSVKKIGQSVAIVYSDADDVIPKKCTEQMIKSLQSTVSKMEIQISGNHSVFKINKDELMAFRGFLGINSSMSDSVSTMDGEQFITDAIEKFNLHKMTLVDQH